MDYYENNLKSFYFDGWLYLFKPEYADKELNQMEEQAQIMDQKTIYIKRLVFLQSLLSTADWEGKALLWTVVPFNAKPWKIHLSMDDRGQAADVELS